MIGDAVETKSDLSAISMEDCHLMLASRKVGRFGVVNGYPIIVPVDYGWTAGSSSSGPGRVPNSPTPITPRSHSRSTSLITTAGRDGRSNARLVNV